MALTYSYNAGTDSYSVVSDSCTAGEVVIPSTYNDGVNGTKSVTSIGGSAFSGCTTLSSIIIPDSVTSIGVEAFYFCTSLTSVRIPNSVTSIGENAFGFCTNLININIPNGITTIDFNVFQECTNLNNIEIPNSVTTIGGYAFYNCSNLRNVTIGNRISNIANSAFQSCSNLIRINFLGNTPTLGSDVFTGTNVNLKIYRYSTKSGWSSTFGGKDVLLIDTASKGLRTFGFNGISSGKTSIKKQNLGGGRIILRK